MTSEQAMQQQQEQVKSFVLSGDPNRAMQQMMDTIDRMRGIYLEENAALATADTQKFLGMQEDKIAAVRRYQEGAAQILERRDELKHIDSALRQQLADRQEEFAGIMAENLKSLDRMRRSVQRLNDRIMNSAREAAQTRHVNYSAKGRLNRNERPVSIGLNESA